MLFIVIKLLNSNSSRSLRGLVISFFGHVKLFPQITDHTDVTSTSSVFYLLSKVERFAQNTAGRDSSPEGTLTLWRCADK